jgi:tetraacyldisaccharide 4'-kinase
VSLPNYRDLISGRSRGPLASIGRGGLGIASALYGGVVRARNRAYDAGLLRAHRAAVPVVSIGNVTAGGTGKTPVVAALVEWFTSRGVRPVILSRGYRAHAGGINDEKLVLDRLCPGVPHLQGADRVATARVACEQHGAQVLILDDAFQHRRLFRDLDLVLVDALDPWGGGRLLPRGLLREPRSALRRAGAVILTRADQCPPADKARLIGEIRSFGRDEPPIEAVFRPVGLENSAGAHAAIDSLDPVVAFCGIGNPDGFRRTLIDAGITQIAAFRAFRDHHHYTEADLADLAQWAIEHRATAFVTTQKDLVKIPRERLGDLPLWAVSIRAEFTAGEERLAALLQDLVSRISAPNLSRFHE